MKYLCECQTNYLKKKTKQKGRIQSNIHSCGRVDNIKIDAQLKSIKYGANISIYSIDIIFANELC